MKASRLRRAAALALPLVLLTVAACAAERPSASAVGYDPSAPPVTITFWFMPNGHDPQKSMQAEADEFHRLHPNITVKPVMLDWGTALTKLSTAAAGGTGPDVSQVGTTWVGGISKAGGLRPYSQPELDALGGRDAFLPSSWTATTLMGTDQVTAVPWLVDIRAVYYRTDVLRAAGLDPAQAFATWDALDRTLRKIQTTTKITPFGQAGENDWNVVHNIAPFIWSAGGDLLSGDGTQPLLASAGSVAGVDYYQRLMARYNTRTLMTGNSEQAAAAFADGKSAVMIQSPDLVARFRSEPGGAGLRAGWSTAPMPAGPAGRFTFLGGSNLAIFKSSAHHAAAFEWVRFLTDQASEGRYVLGRAGLWPARGSVVADKKLTTDPEYRAFATSQDDGRQYPAVAAWTDIEAALTKNFNALWAEVARTGRPLPEDRLRQLLSHADNDVRDAIQQAS